MKNKDKEVMGTSRSVVNQKTISGRASKKSHSFSIELVSRSHMDMISIGSEPKKEVMFEGELGKLMHIEFVEGIILQITGDKGVLRIDLTEKELSQSLSKKKAYDPFIIE